MFAENVLGRKALGYVAPAKQFDGQQADLTEFFFQKLARILCASLQCKLGKQPQVAANER